MAEKKNLLEFPGICGKYDVPEGKIYMTWLEFRNQKESLVKKIKASKIKFDGVYGVPKGGLVLAVCLAHRLKLPLLLDEKKITSKILIAEDISDTGKTLQKFKGKNKIAVLTTTKWTITKPTYFADFKKNQKQWIVYPWEHP